METKIINLEEKFTKLKEKVREYNPRADFELIDKAWEFAKLAHTGQVRLSGDPFIVHPLRTAEILAQWKLDTTSIVVGLLHDAVEKGGATGEDVLKEFGERIWKLVDGVSQISKLGLKGSDEELFVENLRKMFFAMAKDIRVVLVRLAERYHNLETISFLPEEDQKRIAKETLEIYAPLAERLGVGGVKSDLEDMSFKRLYPKEYKDLVRKSVNHYKRADLIIDKMKRALLKELSDNGIKAEIQARKKHLYSLWKKLQRPEIAGDLGKIYDIVALRILVNDIPDCYTALGVVHNLYKPFEALGVSDFIAKPKPNGYRSIHTKVIGPEKRVVEIQIRTFEMHEECEWGVAAHWHLSLLKSKGKLTSEQIEAGMSFVGDKLSWVKELARWQKEIVDSEEFLKAVKFDALSERIFVFSPKGDVYDLPSGATPVDFAYSVHTQLGRYIALARVNGKVVPLDHKLESGDVVEIEKTKTPRKPSPNWLEFVVTTQARREIKRELRGEAQ